MRYYARPCAREFSTLDFPVNSYPSAFGDEYQAIFSTNDAERDLGLVNSLSESHPLRVRIDPVTNIEINGSSAPASCTLVVAKRGTELLLSRSLPILEHAGFEVLRERYYLVHPDPTTSVHLYRFPVRMRTSDSARLLDGDAAATDFRAQVIEGLESLLLGRSEDDVLNILLLRSELNLRAISFLRTLCFLLWQMKKFATRQTIREALAQHPEISRRLWAVWSLKFDPAGKGSVEERRPMVSRELEALREALRAISDITADRIFRSIASIIEHTLRTNFFNPIEYRSAPIVALKIHSEHLDLLSLPRPMFEIFVCHPAFEGVHLRSSKVARGGIRWSDRREDYRTEVRDLMKTQQVKNALIVPSGAKGGFVVKDLPSDRTAQTEAVRTIYEYFIRALLSITDNLEAGTVVHPPGILCYDDEDPYFVVAADKGTATFSDVANRIATDEFNFWLGDAFASGGSHGYDHKRLGVTARGAWETTKQHFYQARIDFERVPFRVIGIGDMSGDVFGNGMLLSEQMQLIAAFNHKHIFIDPQPDVARSFAERKRLFNLAFSQWSDYDKSLVSHGGGVFERECKEIRLTAPIRTALAVPEDTPAAVSGEQLITLILRAPAELLWNGGIGTYVKARRESDADVNDATNDRVRVNADELRVKVVAEGGNLGFTQLARIEFARRGGLINTDAIDNSGGVDTSDHEVNLKILCNGLIKSKKLDFETRNRLLAEMAPAVVEDVLSHNRGQGTLIAITAQRSFRTLEYFQALLAELVKRNYLNRTVHTLPSDEELRERARTKVGLTLPELAVCLAGVKMWIKDELLQTGLTADPLLRETLFDYFPSPLSSRFRDEILAHPLADNLVATQVANDLVETVGLTFVHRIANSRNAPVKRVLSALLAAKEILGLKHLRKEVQRYDNFADHEFYTELRLELSTGLREATTWLITNHRGNSSSNALVSLYKVGIAALQIDPAKVLSGGISGYFNERLMKYQGLRLDTKTRSALAILPLTPILFEFAWTAARAKVDLADAAMMYCTVHDTLELLPILSAQKRVNAVNRWEHELRNDVYEEIRRSISAISVTLLDRGVRDSNAAVRVLRESSGFGALHSTCQELTDRPLEVSMLAVFARQLRLYQALE